MSWQRTSGAWYRNTIAPLTQSRCCDWLLVITWPCRLTSHWLGWTAMTVWRTVLPDKCPGCFYALLSHFLCQETIPRGLRWMACWWMYDWLLLAVMRSPEKSSYSRAHNPRPLGTSSAGIAHPSPELLVVCHWGPGPKYYVFPPRHKWGAKLLWELFENWQSSGTNLAEIIV